MLDNETLTLYIKKAQSGDKKAKEIVYKNNLPLIKFIANKFSNKGIEYDDLIQIANIGLLKAIKNYDASFGTKFTTYSVPMIIGEIKRYMRDNGAIKVSRAIKQTASKINRFCDEFYMANERMPSPKEIAEKLGVSEEDVILALNSTKLPVSIYEQGDDDDNMELIEKLPAENINDEITDKLHFNEILRSLPVNEQKIIILRYFKDKTQSEVAKIMGVSQVQISRLENKILSKMRQIIA